MKNNTTLLTLSYLAFGKHSMFQFIKHIIESNLRVGVGVNKNRTKQNYANQFIAINTDSETISHVSYYIITNILMK